MNLKRIGAMPHQKLDADTAYVAKVGRKQPEAGPHHLAAMRPVEVVGLKPTAFVVAKKRSYKGMVVMHKLYESLDLEHRSSNSI
jgi:hypothetical protein